MMSRGKMNRVRTQVYLEREQHRHLQEEAQALNVPMTELLRRIVADHMHGPRPSPSHQAFMSIVGLGASGESAIAEEHDRYLAEEIADEHLR